MNYVGTEWLVDAAGCTPESLCNLAILESVMRTILSDLELRVVGSPMWHPFPDPGGITGMYLLTESHLTCHTYPEKGIATFNLYCCRQRPEWPWEERLIASLGASSVRVTRVVRGL